MGRPWFFWVFAFAYLSCLVCDANHSPSKEQWNRGSETGFTVSSPLTSEPSALIIPNFPLTVSSTISVDQMPSASISLFVLETSSPTTTPTTDAVTISPTNTRSSTVTPVPIITPSFMSTPTASESVTTTQSSMSTGTTSTTSSFTTTQSTVNTPTSSVTQSSDPTPSTLSTPTPIASPTPLPSNSKTATVSPSSDSTPTGSITVSVTSTVSLSLTPSATETSTPTVSLSLTPTAGITESPTVTITPSTLSTPSALSTSTASATPSALSTPSILSTTTTSATVTSLSSNSNTPSLSPNSSGTQTPSATMTAPVVLSNSVTPSVNATSSPTVSLTRSALSIPTRSATTTMNVTISPTSTMSLSLTPSVDATTSPTVTVTPSGQSTPTASTSSTQTASVTSSDTSTASPSMTPTSSHSMTATSTASVTITPSASTTLSLSSTPSLTATPTVSNSSTSTPSLSRTSTASATMTGTPSVTITPTASTTLSLSSTPSLTATPTISNSSTTTPSLSKTPTTSTTMTATPSASTTRTGTPTNSFSSSNTRTPSQSATVTPTPSASFSSTPISTTTEIWVDNSQSGCTGECGSPVCGCPTIFSALNQIDRRSTQTIQINIMPGTYTGPGNTNLFFPNDTKATVILTPAVSQQQDRDDNLKIIIECAHSYDDGFIFSGSSGGSFQLEQISFNNCGTGVAAISKGLIVRSGAVVTGNNIFVHGKIAIEDKAYFACTNCTFGQVNPNMDDLDIVFDESFFYVSNSEINIQGSEFQYISTRSFSQNYIIAAIDLRESFASFSDCYFHDNLSDGRSDFAASCIYATGQDAQMSNTTAVNLVLSNCTFTSNIGTTVVLVEDQNISLNGVDFDEHSQGSMIVSYGCSGNIVDSSFTRNTDILYGTCVIVPSRRLLEGEPSFTFDNCLFHTNINLVSYGGAIYLESGSLTVLNSQFIENRGRKGGAIYSGPQLIEGADSEPDFNLLTSNRTLIVSNSLFERNTVSRSGGAIQLEGNVTTLSIEFSNFTDNTAPEGQGGALNFFIPDGAGQAELTNNRFVNNNANAGVGGAVHLSGDGQFTLNLFEKNTARSAGALHIDGGYLVLKQNLFYSNTAESGGALFISQDASGTASGNYYYANQATLSGGAMYIGGDSDFSFDDEILFNNTADSVGGALTVNERSSPLFTNTRIEYSQTTGSGAVNCMGQSTPTFQNCQVEYNFASQEGAGVYIQDKSAPIFSTCSISYNNCSTAAGGIVASENAKGLFQNCSIMNNVANNNAGGMKLNGDSSTRFVDCNVIGNQAAGDGGGISVEDQSTAEFQNGVIANNTATSAGGGIAVHGSTTATFYYTVIKFNFALSHGGGISLQDRSRAVFNSCSIFQNGSPVNGGGVVAMDVTVATLFNCSISNNFASSNGAGVQISSFAEPLIDSCTISDNKASSKGGGIQLANYCRPLIRNTSITNNKATNGAGISQSNFARPSFESTDITDNEAESQAGGILLEDSSQGTYTNCHIDFNTAKSGSGGGLLALDTSNSTFSACSFSNNYATTSGSGVQIASNAYPTFMTCHIASNTIYATSGGGVVATGNSYPTFSNCVITNNSAESGAGLWIGKDSSPFIIHAVISNNNANHRGGGIYLQTGANANITLSTFTNNTAFQGGAFYGETRAAGFIFNSTFNLNQAIADGGGGYLSCSDTQFSFPAFVQNTAPNGGGICIQSCIIPYEMTLLDQATFFQNVATNGGGIYIAGDSSIAPYSLTSSSSASTVYTCSNCSFTSNTADYGGAIFLSVDSFPVSLGPVVIIDSNSAKKIGGGAFMVDLDSLPSFPWLTGAQFSNNNAIWAASTVGFGNIPPNATEDQISLFCENCDFASDNTAGTVTTAGYQTKNGFATAPVMASFETDRSCPPSVWLEDDPFSIGLILLDQFQTPVQGLIFNSATYAFNISVLSTPDFPCGVIADNRTEQLTTKGTAMFTNVEIEGTEDNPCTLQFTPILYPQNDPVLPTSCSVITSGCPNGKHQQSDADSMYDTCIDNTGISWVSTVSLTSVLILILLLLIFILCYCLFAMHRRQKPKPDRFVGSLPDFDRSEQVTIYEILNDPQIPVIPWENIVKYERIGIGGSGMVWRGEQRTKTDIRPVALKQLLFGIDNITEKLVWEFLREIKLMSALRHENVVEFLGVSVSDTEEQELYLVTELMQNGSLSDLFAKKKFNMPWPLRLRLIQDAACGMAYLHSRNLIHRDLKSQNLLVNDQWICKIADFGISTIKPAAEKTMTCIGTPVYMAPEVIGNNKYSEKADIFSFGVLLVEAYTLKPPYSEPIFQSFTQAQLMYQICHQNLRPPTDNLPLPLVQLVNDCWNENPDLRPSFPEIIIRLHRLETLSLGDDLNFPKDSEVVPFRNAHTYTTFHEMIAPDDSADIAAAELSLNTDEEDDPLLSN